MQVRAYETVKAGGVYRYPGTDFEWRASYGDPEPLIERGVIGRSEAEPEPEPAEEGEVEVEIAGGLPGDFPAREIVKEAGITTLEAALEVQDWDAIEGIGQAREQQIVEYLGALQEE